MTWLLNRTFTEQYVSRKLPSSSHHRFPKFRKINLTLAHSDLDCER
jgi:hypothetical protein